MILAAIVVVLQASAGQTSLEQNARRTGGRGIPFYRVAARELLIEADSPTDAAMVVYRIFEERSPNQFDVVGPDAEINHVTLNDQQQEQAITIGFARKSNTLT